MPIKPLRHEQVSALIDLSLRAWDPVFQSIQSVMTDEIYSAMHSDWRDDQRKAVEAVCSAEDVRVWVTEFNNAVAGFVAVKFDDVSRTGEIYMVAVDPDYQQQGVGAALTEFAVEQMKLAGMKLAMVETGGDPGHSPARKTYEKCGFEPLPIVRYFRNLETD